MVVSLFHFTVNKPWLYGRKPKIIVRASPITQMVIYTAASAALLLFGIAETSHITVVVVTPHQRYIVRNFYAVLHYLKHFFIRKEYLRYHPQVLIYILCEQPRSEEHTSELQAPDHIVCRLLLA